MDPNNVDWSNEEQRNAYLKSQIDAAVSTEVNGLKSKNQELLDKLKAGQANAEQLAALQKTFESLGGEDGVKQLTEFQSKIANDERMKKLMSGEVSQIQEVIDAETGAMKANYENQITALTERAEAAEKNALGYQTQIRDSDLRALCGAAAVKLGCNKGVDADVFRHAQETFTWNEEHGCHVISDNGVIKIGEDGKTPMSVVEWLDTTRDDNSYRWPPSVGGGAGGSNFQGDGGSVNTDGMPMGDYREARRAGKIT